MHFVIEGVDSHGAEASLLIEAKSEQDAVRQAKSKGIFVSDVSRDRDAEKAQAEKLLMIQEKAAIKRSQKKTLADKQALLNQRFSKIQNSIKAGRRVFMYMTQFTTVDSKIDDETIASAPDLHSLQMLGINSVLPILVWVNCNLL